MWGGKKIYIYIERERQRDRETERLQIEPQFIFLITRLRKFSYYFPMNKYKTLYYLKYSLL